MTFETLRPTDKDGDKVELGPELHKLMEPMVTKIMATSMLMYQPFISCHIVVDQKGGLVIKYNEPIPELMPAMVDGNV
jgi:hypothetical protein